MVPVIFRPAIAMIELIFSLVIMGIVLMSAPMLIHTAADSTSVALQQEGINEAASRINLILTYPWDNAVNADSNCSTLPSILGVEDNTSGLNNRPGVPSNSNAHGSTCGSSGFLYATPIGQEIVGVVDDLDDFNQDSNLTVLDLGTGGTDYLEKNTVKMATKINYASDQLSTGVYAASQNITFNFSPDEANQTTNIKAITVTLTSRSGVNELNKTIVMRAFSCNVGGFMYEQRTF